MKRVHGLLSLALVACGGSGGDGGGSPAAPADGPVTLVKSDDGRVTLEVPEAAGVDASTIRIRVRQDVTPIPRAVAFAYTLEPTGLTFAKPATFRWEGPVEGLRGEITTPDITWMDIPLLALRSYQSDADVAPVSLTEQKLEIDLDKGSASLRGKLSHFTDVVAEQPGVAVAPNTPDHEKFAGHLSIGFLGLNSLPFNSAPDTLNAPVVGMRFWINKEVGVPINLGFASASANGQPLQGGLFGATATLTNAGDEKRFDPPVGLPVPAGIPIAFALSHHYAFQGTPNGADLRVDVSTKITAKPAPPCPADLAISAKRGAEIFFGFLAGLNPEQSCAKTPASTEPTAHSSGTQSKLAEPSTNIFGTGFEFHSFRLGTTFSMFHYSLFQCGQGEVAFTVCPNGKALPEPGDFVLMTMALAADVPIADSANRYVYSFVLDADDDPGNNYAAPAKFPKDFYDGTDRWYEASYAPATGWVLTAKDAHGPTPTNFPTAARLMIKENAIMLAVPAGEIPSKKPRWRATSFRHKGDYGVNPPYDWSGDVVPPVGQLYDAP